jgi:hypothetical protein
MATGKDGKDREHNGKGKNTETKHQYGQARNKADQQRSPNPNTRAGKAIIQQNKEAKKNQGKGK